MENFYALILLKQAKLYNKIEKAEPLVRQIGSAFLLTEGGRKLTRQYYLAFLTLVNQQNTDFICRICLANY